MNACRLWYSPSLLQLSAFHEKCFKRLCTSQITIDYQAGPEVTLVEVFVNKTAHLL